MSSYWLWCEFSLNLVWTHTEFGVYFTPKRRGVCTHHILVRLLLQVIHATHLLVHSVKLMLRSPVMLEDRCITHLKPTVPFPLGEVHLKVTAWASLGVLWTRVACTQNIMFIVNNMLILCQRKLTKILWVTVELNQRSLILTHCFDLQVLTTYNFKLEYQECKPPAH